MSHTSVSPKSFKILVWLGFWTLMGVFDATETGLRAATNKTPIEWSRALALGLSLWYEWAILAWVLARLARCFPWSSDSACIGFWSICLLGAIFAVAKLCMDYPVIELSTVPSRG